jgi:pimeloyl-ACP methyl ester carboxylesterase
LKKKDNTPGILKVVRWIYPRLERFAPSLAHRYFVKLFFTPFRFSVPEKEKQAETFSEKFFVLAAGKKIQCYTWGSGPPVVVIHGWGGRATQFRRFIKPLTTAGYQVVGFDGPAHGNSEGKRTNIVEFEEVLLKIYEKVGQPVGILAHSFGGSVALFAAMKGLIIPKLINIASPTIGDEIINTYLRAINGSESTRDYFKKYTQKKYGKPFDEFTSSYFSQHLPRPVAVLLVHDESDKEVIIEHAERFIKLYPTAKLIKTKGLGHTRILKDDQVIRACVTFIQGEASARKTP